MKLNYSRFVIPIVSAVAGVLLVFGAMKYGPWSEEKVARVSQATIFDQVLHDDFFDQQELMKNLKNSGVKLPGTVEK
ncbi:MAG: hypothetical protein EOP48_12320 [Sphingobacteriales bacterium]|nr:MAG: hypothetical protein EOP48_12320 [Sphingobacteriales bacterium]